MKKNILIIVLIVLLTGSYLQALTRHQLYRFFGPKLLEAIVLVIKDEINILRLSNGLTVRTNQQLIKAIETKLDTINDYDWMDQQ